MQGYQGGVWDSGDGNGVAERVKDFDGIAVLAAWRAVMIDNSHDVTATQPVLWNITSKSSVSIEFEGHGGLSFRNQVMNFVKPDNFSSIQTDRTRSVMPFGPASAPRIS